MFFSAPSNQPFNQQQSQNYYQTPDMKSLAKRRENQNNRIRRDTNNQMFQQKREINSINNDFYWADANRKSLHSESTKQYQGLIDKGQIPQDPADEIDYDAMDLADNFQRDEEYELNFYPKDQPIKNYTENLNNNIKNDTYEETNCQPTNFNNY